MFNCCKILCSVAFRFRALWDMTVFCSTNVPCCLNEVATLKLMATCFCVGWINEHIANPRINLIGSIQHKSTSFERKLNRLNFAVQSNLGTRASSSGILCSYTDDSPQSLWHRLKPNFSSIFIKYVKYYCEHYLVFLLKCHIAVS